MTLTLKIDTTLEHRLRQQAARRGIKPDSYAVAAIQEQLRRDGAQAPRLSRKEASLLRLISLGFSPGTWDRYDALISKRQDGSLTRRELAELKGLTDRLEERNVRRMEALTKLARLRNTSLESLIDELQIKPHRRANN